MDKITINIPMNLDVSDDDLDNILVTAFEGGSNYWIDKIEVKDYKGCEFASHVISKGGKLIIITDDEQLTLTKNKQLKGISKWFAEYYYPRQIVKHNLEMPSSFSDIDFDAGDTDIIIQLAIFNEVVYG